MLNPCHIMFGMCTYWCSYSTNIEPLQVGEDLSEQQAHAEKFCLLLASLIKDFEWLEVDLELMWNLLPASVLRATGEATYYLTLMSSAMNINKTGKPMTDSTSAKTIVSTKTNFQTHFLCIASQNWIDELMHENNGPKQFSTWLLKYKEENGCFATAA